MPNVRYSLTIDSKNTVSDYVNEDFTETDGGTLVIGPGTDLDFVVPAVSNVGFLYLKGSHAFSVKLNGGDTAIPVEANKPFFVSGTVITSIKITTTVACNLEYSIAGPNVGTCINVSSYGAIGNGIADDYAAIQAALDAATYGTTICLPKGTFNCSAGLKFKNNNVRILGITPGVGDNTDPSTKISFTSTIDYGITTLSNTADYTTGYDWCTIENLIIEGNNKVTSGLLITDFVTVRNCYVRQCTNCIHIPDYSNQTLIEHCIGAGGTYGLLCDGRNSTMLHVTDSYFTVNSGAGAFLKTGTNQIFQNCYFEGNTGYGVHILGVQSATPSVARFVIGTTFRNCWFEANGSSLTAGTTQYNLYIDGEVGLGYEFTGKWMTFDHCTFSCDLPGSVVTARAVRIANGRRNTFSNCRFYGGDTANLITLDATAYETVFIDNDFTGIESPSVPPSNLISQGTNTQEWSFNSSKGTHTHNNTLQSPQIVVTALNGDYDANVNADDLIVSGTGNRGISVIGGATSGAGMFMGKPGSLAMGQVQWDNNNNWLMLYGNAAGSAVYIKPTGVGIGSASSDASALLQLTSTTQGFRPPVMTTAQRLAIASPASGLTVYDGDLLDYYVYNGTAWEKLSTSAGLGAFDSLHVGGTSDPGDNNALIDGTLEVTGATTLTGLTKTVAGVHVGGTSDPGADNLLVDGTAEVTGITTLTGLVKTAGGVHVGGTSDPGADNLLVDGTCEVTGITTLTGLTKTAGGVHVGGTSDPGADNLLVDGTLEVTGITTHTGLTKTAGGVHVGGTSDPGADNLLVDGTLEVTGVSTFGSASHHASFAADGELTLTGTARVRKEIRVEAITTKQGSSAPSIAERAVGASGGVLMPVLTFSKVTQQDCYFIIHSPADLDATVPVKFHLMWQPGAAWTTGTYKWKLEYLVMNENGATLLAGSPTTIDVTITPSNATTNIETEYADNITLAADQMMVCHFYRDVADTGDDIGCVSFFEIEYTANCLGEAT